MSNSRKRGIDADVTIGQMTQANNLLIQYFTMKEILQNTLTVNMIYTDKQMIESYFRTTLFLLYALEISQVFSEENNPVTKQLYLFLDKNKPIQSQCVEYLNYFQMNYWCLYETKLTYDITTVEGVRLLQEMFTKYPILTFSFSYGNEMNNYIQNSNALSPDLKQAVLYQLGELYESKDSKKFRNYKSILFDENNNWKSNIMHLMQSLAPEKP